MNELQIFQNQTFGEVRTIMQNGEPWFVAADVCKALEIDRTQTRRLDADEKGVYSTQTPGGTQNVSIVNEAGLYSLVLGSRKPEAKAFKRWITHDVIPSLRKHGMYAKDELLDNPDLLLDVVQQLKRERDARRALEAENATMQPKALFADAVTASHTSILIGELAKIIKQNGIDIGQQRLFAWLRDNGYLMKTGNSYNMPTQKAMERGLFEIKESTKQEPNGSVRIMRTTKVTGKGQVYFVNLFLEKQGGQNEAGNNVDDDQND